MNSGRVTVDFGEYLGLDVQYFTEREDPHTGTPAEFSIGEVSDQDGKLIIFDQSEIPDLEMVVLKKLEKQRFEC